MRRWSLEAYQQRKDFNSIKPSSRRREIAIRREEQKSLKLIPLGVVGKWWKAQKTFTTSARERGRVRRSWDSLATHIAAGRDPDSDSFNDRLSPSKTTSQWVSTSTAPAGGWRRKKFDKNFSRRAVGWETAKPLEEKEHREHVLSSFFLVSVHNSRSRSINWFHSRGQSAAELFPPFPSAYQDALRREHNVVSAKVRRSW